MFDKKFIRRLKIIFHHKRIKIDLKFIGGSYFIYFSLRKGAFQIVGPRHCEEERRSNPEILYNGLLRHKWLAMTAHYKNDNLKCTLRNQLFGEMKKLSYFCGRV